MIIIMFYVLKTQQDDTILNIKLVVDTFIY